MGSIKNLKKDVNFVFGDIIEAVYIWQLTNPEKDVTVSETIIDEAIVAFDETMDSINAKNIENKKAHFKSVRNSVEEKGRALIDKLNNL